MYRHGIQLTLGDRDRLTGKRLETADMTASMSRDSLSNLTRETLGGLATNVGP